MRVKPCSLLLAQCYDGGLDNAHFAILHALPHHYGINF